jgi:hypothetical protein
MKRTACSQGFNACYNLHLESRSNDELRRAQLEDVLQDSAKYDSASPVILAGP